jgi:hypothetical protein
MIFQKPKSNPLSFLWPKMRIKISERKKIIEFIMFIEKPMKKEAQKKLICHNLR